MFEINTKGSCLLCLKDCTGVEEQRRMRTPTPPSWYQQQSTPAFQLMMRYLEIDVVKLGNFHPSLQLEQNQSLGQGHGGGSAGFEMKPSDLCHQCSGVMTRFFNLYENHGDTLLEMDECVRTLHGYIRDGSTSLRRKAEYENKMKSRNPLELLCGTMAENLRVEAKKQCLKKLREAVARITCLDDFPLPTPLPLWNPPPPSHAPPTATPSYYTQDAATHFSFPASSGSSSTLTSPSAHLRTTIAAEWPMYAQTGSEINDGGISSSNATSGGASFESELLSGLPLIIEEVEGHGGDEDGDQQSEFNMDSVSVAADNDTFQNTSENANEVALNSIKSETSYSCDWRFVGTHNCADHKKRALNSSGLTTCIVCGRVGSSPSNLKRHMLSKHPLQLLAKRLPRGTSDSQLQRALAKSMERMVVKGKDSTRRFCCPYCSKEMWWKSEVKNHVLDKHLGKVVVKLRGILKEEQQEGEGHGGRLEAIVDFERGGGGQHQLYPHDEISSSGRESDPDWTP